MATFILIHGAWHGGWSFDPIVPLLTAEGHQVIHPHLPGMGGTRDELAQATLANWADYVADLCRTAAGPVILAGHSRGGLVISEAAERAPDAISALVYICAMMLPSGLSREQWRAMAEPNPAFRDIILPHESGIATIIDTARAGAIFAQLSPDEAVQAVLPRLMAEPDQPRLTPLALTAERYGQVPRHYIECLYDKTIPLSDQRQMQALQPCASVTALPADHSPFLSTPEALAEALLGIARAIEPKALADVQSA
ncbi:MAG: alpha/beta fold hydrolase [Chakrabartia sp.]